MENLKKNSLMLLLSLILNNNLLTNKTVVKNSIRLVTPVVTNIIL